MNLRIKRQLFWSLALIGFCFIPIYLWLGSQTNNQVELLKGPPHSKKPLSRRKPTLNDRSIYQGSGPSLIQIGDLLAHCIIALKLGGKQVVELSEDKQLHIGSKGQTLEGVDDVVTEADLRSHRKIIELLEDNYPRLKVVSEENESYTPQHNSVKHKKSKTTLALDRIELSRMLNHEKEQIGPNGSAQISLEDTLIWVDPLDATKEYSEKLTHFVTLMACIVHKGEPVAGIIFKPFLNETYWSLYNHKEPMGHPHYSVDLKRAIEQRSTLSSSKSVSHQMQQINFIISRSHAGNLESVIKKSPFGPISSVTPAGGAGYKTIELISGRVDSYVHLTRIKKWDICAPSSILNSLDGFKLTDLDGRPIGFDDPRAIVVETGVLATTNSKLHSDLIRLMSNRNNS